MSSATTCSTQKQIRHRRRARVPGSKRWMAEQSGISPAEQYRLERHVAIATRYPFMQQRGWRMSHVFKADTLLAQCPDDDRLRLTARIEQEGMGPHAALAMLREAVLVDPDENDRAALAALRTDRSMTQAERQMVKAARSLLIEGGRERLMRVCAQMFWSLSDCTAIDGMRGED